MAEYLNDPAMAGEALADALAYVDAVEAAAAKGESRRNMELIDAIGLLANLPHPLKVLGSMGTNWGFDPAVCQKAITAWRAPAGRGRGSGRRAAVWPIMAEVLRSAGAQPPSPESLRKEHERWRKTRGRPQR